MESTLLRYLPPYFEFNDEEVKKEQELSPKNTKRQKQMEKQENFMQLLRPQNFMDCESTVTTSTSVNNAPMHQEYKQHSSKNKLYKKLDGE